MSIFQRWGRIDAGRERGVPAGRALRFARV
jgi:hypothetical protein